MAPSKAIELVCLACAGGVRHAGGYPGNQHQARKRFYVLMGGSEGGEREPCPCGVRAGERLTVGRSVVGRSHRMRHYPVSRRHVPATLSAAPFSQSAAPACRPARLCHARPRGLLNDARQGATSLGSTRPFQPVAVDPAERIIVASVQLSTVTIMRRYQHRDMMALS